jgi:hypothetical protein
METKTIASPRLFATRVGQEQKARGWAWPLTVALHGLGAAAVVVLPLVASEPLPSEGDRVTIAFFVAPADVVPPPPPPPPAAARAATAPRVAQKADSLALTAPVEIPHVVRAGQARRSASISRSSASGETSGRSTRPARPYQ